MLFRFRFFIVFILFPACFIFSQAGSVSGAGVSSAAAEWYLQWAEQAISGGRWDEALAALERGRDFADVSSDISCLLAVARYHKKQPLRSALDSLGRAFETDRWERYSPAQTRLLEAELLVGLRRYAEALGALALAEQGPGAGFGEGGAGEGRPLPPAASPDGADAAVLRLLALRGLGETEELLRAARAAMERYPRDPRPAGILFSWALGRGPESPAGPREAGGASALGGEDRALIDLALRRLPILLEAQDAGDRPNFFGLRSRCLFTPLGLACLAAPFIRDTAEARRLVSARRALGEAEPGAVPVSLDLGIIDEEQALAELFDPGDGPEPALGRDLILQVWSLLRTQESRTLFRLRLLRFSGTIKTDADGDGTEEERTRYVSGLPREYCRDADQDGLDELRLSFSSGGLPQEAWLVQEGGGPEIHLRWERYPAVLDAEAGGFTYSPAPETFFYAPVRFSRIPGSLSVPGLGKELAILYPEGDPQQVYLSGRTLVSFALAVTRPSLEFPGGFERIELDRGIPRRALEIVNDQVVAVTEFVRGQPRIQRLDLDLDGRMETVRRFREGAAAEGPLDYERILESVETDRDRDGLYEAGEQFLPDGTIIYSWDTDGDGIRDFSERRTKR